MGKAISTLEKLGTLSLLEAGWHYGEGVPPLFSCVAIVEPLLIKLQEEEIATDIFPGLDGEVRLTTYRGSLYEEYTFEIDGTVTYARERGDVEEVYIEGKSIEWATGNILTS